MPPKIPQQLQPQARQQTISQIKRSKQKDNLKITTPSQPTQAIPTEASRLEEGRRQVVELDKLIKKFEAEASKQDLRYNQAKNLSTAESADRRRTLLRERVSQLRGVKGFAKTGKYDLNSIIGYAQEVANARYSRTRPRSSAEVLQQKKFDEQVQQQKDQQKSFQEQITKLKSQGITPVYRDGELVGFRDNVQGISLETEQLIKGYTRQSPDLGLGDEQLFTPRPK